LSEVVQTSRFARFDNPRNRSRQQGEKWGESQVVRGLGTRFISNCEGPHLFCPLDFLPPEREWGPPMFQFELNRLSSRSGTVAAARPKRNTPTILIAEDSRDGREMLQVLLGLKGYSVLTAADAAGWSKSRSSVFPI